MGMTIEQKIKTLLELYHYIKGDTHFCGYNEETATQSLETAIETMRKYQKMQEVLEKVWNIPSCMIDKAECLDRIMETYRTVR